MLNSPPKLNASLPAFVSCVESLTAPDIPLDDKRTANDNQQCGFPPIIMSPQPTHHMQHAHGAAKKPHSVHSIFIARENRAGKGNHSCYSYLVS